MIRAPGQITTESGIEGTVPWYAAIEIEDEPCAGLSVVPSIATLYHNRCPPASARSNASIRPVGRLTPRLQGLRIRRIIAGK